MASEPKSSVRAFPPLDIRGTDMAWQPPLPPLSPPAAAASATTVPWTYPTQVCTHCATLWWSDASLTPGCDEADESRCPSSDTAMKQHCKRDVGAPETRRPIRRGERLASKTKARLVALKTRFGALCDAVTGKVVDAMAP